MPFASNQRRHSRVVLLHRWTRSSMPSKSNTGSRGVSPADPGAGRPRLPPRDALRDRVLAPQVDVSRVRQDRIDGLSVAVRRASERAQEREEALDLVPVQLEPEDSGAARVGSALLQVADGSATRPAGELRVVKRSPARPTSPVSSSMRVSMFEPDRGVAQTRNERSIPTRSIASRAWSTRARAERRHVH